MSEAEKKFWKTLELHHSLLPFLDLESTLHLAQAHEVTKNILEDPYVWNKLIKRSFPFINRRTYQDPQPKIDAVNNFVVILKLMKNPKALLPELLHLICERFSADPKYTAERYNSGLGLIQMTCSTHTEPHSFHAFPSHSLGFLLVEQVEEAFGTTELRLEMIRGGILSRNLLTAVTSRMTRQQTPLTLFNPTEVVVDNMRSAETFDDLMHIWPEEVSRQIELRVSGGSRVWELVARAIQFQPNVVRFITTEREVLTKGRREDLETIWNAVGLKGFRFEEIGLNEFLREVVEKQEGEDAWVRLEQIMEMTEREWIAHLEGPEPEWEDLSEEDDEEGEFGEEQVDENVD